MSREFNCVSMTHLNALSHLTAVTGDLHLECIFALRQLDDLNNLRTVGGDFVVRYVDIDNFEGMGVFSLLVVTSWSAGVLVTCAASRGWES